MKLYKTMVAVSGGGPDYDGTLFKMDTIEYEGFFWLVPEWTENKDRKVMKPNRIILLNILRHQVNENKAFGDFLLNDPIPKAVLDGRIPPELANKYVVREGPPIVLPVPETLH